MKEQVHGGDVYRHPDVIDFSSNMNPLGTPKALTDAVIDSMQRIAQYPDIRCERLIEALSVYEGVDKEQLICGNGAADLIFSLVQALRPKRALIQAPTFVEYAQALESVGCEVSYYDSTADGYRITKRYVDSLDETYDIAFLCNPNNPTGFLIEPEILNRVVDVCKEKEIFLVVDECFQDFVPEEKQFSLKGRLKDSRNLFLLKAFTKRYAMAGLRLGYGITGNTELLDRIGEITQPWNVSIPAQEAGLAALKETVYVQKGLEMVQTELAWLKTQFAALGLKTYDSQANYLFFEGPEDLKERCLEQKILIRSCSNYVGLEKKHFRIAVRKHEDNAVLIGVLQKILTVPGRSEAYIESQA